MQKINTANIT